MEKKPDISLLYDFYGDLLKPSGQRVVELYVNEDLSLSEVSENLGISRQGVRDALERASKNLREFEEKLGLMRRHRDLTRAVEDIAAASRKIRTLTEDEEIIRLTRGIEDSADRLRESEA